MRSAVFLLTFVPLGFGAGFDPSLLRDGDIIFQTSKSGQSLAIQEATHSPFSHCGLIYRENGKLFVFEASNKVKVSPLRRFIKKGDGEKFWIKRIRNADSLLTPENLAKLKAEGKKHDGKPYDGYFGWGDDRIYCSELVYKIYRDALRIEIGKTRKMRDFDLTSPAVITQLKERYGDSIPLDETVIAPVDLYQDSNWVEILSH